MEQNGYVLMYKFNSEEKSLLTNSFIFMTECFDLFEPKSLFSIVFVWHLSLNSMVCRATERTNNGKMPFVERKRYN